MNKDKFIGEFFDNDTKMAVQTRTCEGFYSTKCVITKQMFLSMYEKWVEHKEPQKSKEARLRSDMVTMLTELQLEIEENVLADDPNTLLPFLQARETCVAIIQQKINALKAEGEEVYECRQ